VKVDTGLDIRPVTRAIGAEVAGVDLRRPLDTDVVAALRAALAHHCVLFFRDQRLSPEDQVAFARQFGEPTPAHPVIPAVEGHPEVLRIDGRDDRAAWWHTDVTFMQTPPLGSILSMDEIPAVGGDTLWVSTQAAYDALSEPVRAMCDTLIALHHDPFFAADVAERGGMEWDGRRVDALTPVVHPVVRTHPETNRNGLFVNPQFTRLIIGLSPVESDGVLDMLYRHMQKPEFSCRFRWEAGSVAFWDNRATMHYAVDDYGDEVRVAYRVTLRGPVPYGPAMPPRPSAPAS
jgi:alpha-ketoglutarate-dependent taurine dioxygenase